MATDQDSPMGGVHASHVSLPDTSTLLKAKLRQAINRLMATYLSNLEELADEHEEAMGKLVDALPDEHKSKVVLADIYGDTRYAAIRSHVLTAGNTQLREMEEQIDALTAIENHQSLSHQ